MDAKQASYPHWVACQQQTTASRGVERPFPLSLRPSTDCYHHPTPQASRICRQWWTLPSQNPGHQFHNTRTNASSPHPPEHSRFPGHTPGLIRERKSCSPFRWGTSTISPPLRKQPSIGPAFFLVARKHSDHPSGMHPTLAGSFGPRPPCALTSRRFPSKHSQTGPGASPLPTPPAFPPATGFVSCPHHAGQREEEEFL